MDSRSLQFDISRTDDADWLAQLREKVATNECYSDDDRQEISAAIDLRFSQLNLLAQLNAGKPTEGNEESEGNL